MSDSPLKTAPAGRVRRRFSLKDLVVRAWSLVIMLVIMWTMVMAVVYMVRYVLRPAGLPAWVREGQPSLQRELTRSDLTAGTAGTPLAHYHNVNVRIRPDRFNTCTVSGCHQPLPHSESKELRAFANFHTTFVSCELCHDKTITGPVHATWRDKTTGRPRGAPAALLLMRQLEVDADKIEKQPDAEHATIVDRLSALLEESGTDPLLAALLVRIRTAEPGSPVWRIAVTQLRRDVAKHVTGEYGAELTLAENESERTRQRSRLADLTREVLASATGSLQRQEATRRIHEQVVAKPIGCIACHGGKTDRIDYAALEYPPFRQQALRHLPVAALIQMNRRGEAFYLPGMVDRPAATRPAKP